MRTALAVLWLTYRYFPLAGSMTWNFLRITVNHSLHSQKYTKERIIEAPFSESVQANQTLQDRALTFGINARSFRKITQSPYSPKKAALNSTADGFTWVGKNHPPAVPRKQHGNCLENGAYRDSSLFLQESPRCNNYVYGTEGKDSRGEERYPAHEEIAKERKGGIYLPNRTKGKEVRLDYSRFKHCLRWDPTKFQWQQTSWEIEDFSHRVRDAFSLLNIKYNKDNRKILSRHILKHTRAQRPAFVALCSDCCILGTWQEIYMWSSSQLL